MEFNSTNKCYNTAADDASSPYVYCTLILILLEVYIMGFNVD